MLPRERSGERTLTRGDALAARRLERARRCQCLLSSDSGTRFGGFALPGCGKRLRFGFQPPLLERHGLRGFVFPGEYLLRDLLLGLGAPFSSFAQFDFPPGTQHFGFACLPLRFNPFSGHCHRGVLRLQIRLRGLRGALICIAPRLGTLAFIVIGGGTGTQCLGRGDFKAFPLQRGLRGFSLGTGARLCRRAQQRFGFYPRLCRCGCRLIRETARLCSSEAFAFGRHARRGQGECRTFGFSKLFGDTLRLVLGCTPLEGALFGRPVRIVTLLERRRGQPVGFYASRGRLLEFLFAVLARQSCSRCLFIGLAPGLRCSERGSFGEAASLGRGERFVLRLQARRRKGECLTFGFSKLFGGMLRLGFGCAPLEGVLFGGALRIATLLQRRHGQPVGFYARRGRLREFLFSLLARHRHVARIEFGGRSPGRLPLRRRLRCSSYARLLRGVALGFGAQLGCTVGFGFRPQALRGDSRQHALCFQLRRCLPAQRFLCSGTTHRLLGKAFFGSDFCLRRDKGIAFRSEPLSHGADSVFLAGQPRRDGPFLAALRIAPVGGSRRCCLIHGRPLSYLGCCALLQHPLGRVARCGIIVTASRLCLQHMPRHRFLMRRLHIGCGSRG